MSASPAKSLFQFETPPEGLTVHCECGGATFRLAIHARLGGAMTKRTAQCTVCGHEEEI